MTEESQTGGSSGGQHIALLRLRSQGPLTATASAPRDLSRDSRPSTLPAQCYAPSDAVTHGNGLRRGAEWGARDVNVEYVRMQFPDPSETFATNKVRVLRQAGVSLIVLGLRPRHDRADDILEERRLVGLATSHNGSRPRSEAWVTRWLVLRSWAAHFGGSLRLRNVPGATLC